MKGRTLLLGFFTLLVVGAGAAGIFFFLGSLQKKNLFKAAATTEDLGQRIERWKEFLSSYPDDEAARARLAEDEEALTALRFGEAKAVEVLADRILALEAFLKDHPGHGGATEALKSARSEAKREEAYAQKMRAAGDSATSAEAAGTPASWESAVAAAKAAAEVKDTEEARRLVARAEGKLLWARARVAQAGGDLDAAVMAARAAKALLAGDADFAAYLADVEGRAKTYAEAAARAGAAEAAKDWKGAKTAWAEALAASPPSPAAQAGAARVAGVLAFLTSMEEHFVIPSEEVDQHGNAVTLREGSRSDPATGLPCEIWLKAPVMEFVLVPAGTTALPGEGEAPAREVGTAKAVYVGKYEMTQAQWGALVAGYQVPFEEDALPVTRVKWFQCKGVVDALNETLGAGEDAALRFGLPVDGVWEYACRAGATGCYCSGEDAAALETVAWFAANAEDRVHPVGKKAPNAWGLYDVHGNVWEWCGVEGRELSRPLRGGSFRDEPEGCRASARKVQTPRWEGDDLGLRLAVEVNVAFPK